MCTNRKDTPLFKITSSRLVLYLIIKLKVECSTQKLKSFVVFFKKNMVYLQTTQVVQINNIAKCAIKHGGLYKNWVKWQFFSNSTPCLIRLKQAI